MAKVQLEFSLGFSHQIIANYNNAIWNLLQRRPARDDRGRIQCSTLILSPEAFERWLLFWKETEKKFTDYGELEPIKDWGSKLPGACARIAGLLHLAAHVYDKEFKAEIELHTMKTAIETGKCLSQHALAAFGVMGADPDLEGARRILKWIQDKHLQSFTQRECHHSLQSYFRRVAPLTRALALLTERFLIRECQKQKASHRTGRLFEVNPNIRMKHL